MKYAYHFVGKTLRDGRPIPKNGVWLEHDGELSMCNTGLHASIDPFDALQYAPGDTLCRVVVGGNIIVGDDKLVASRRKIVRRINAKKLMRKFACECALSVAHLWDMPPVVREYLTTRKESLRDAARDAARAASWAAAWAAAGDAARDAAWDAARDASWDAAWDAARAAAWDAAWAAARDVAGDVQRKRFNAMVKAAFRSKEAIAKAEGK